VLYACCMRVACDKEPFWTGRRESAAESISHACRIQLRSNQDEWWKTHPLHDPVWMWLYTRIILLPLLTRYIKLPLGITDF